MRVEWFLRVDSSSFFLAICMVIFFFGNSNKDNKITNRIEKKLILMVWIVYQWPISVRGRNEVKVPSKQLFISISGHLISLFFNKKKGGVDK